MGDGRNAHTFRMGNLGKRNYFGDPVIEDLDIKMDPKEIKWEGVDRIDPDQDRDLWWDLINVVIKHRFT
jgi:aminopeptidase C